MTVPSETAAVAVLPPQAPTDPTRDADATSAPSGGSHPSPRTHGAHHPHHDHVSLHDTLHPMPLSVPGDTLGPGATAAGLRSLVESTGTAEAGTTALPEGPRLPEMPKIGFDEHVYSRLARKADEAGDRHAREAAKVGMYVTLALNPKMPWKDKLRHFQHALNKHCHVETKVNHRTWSFYHGLANLVREHCGQEALRLASHEDDLYAARLSMGTSRVEIEREARPFFESLIGRGKECPDYMRQDEYVLIRMIRDQWI